MQSTPPGHGPSFNQMMLIAMIVAILIIMGLLVFDPRVRLERRDGPSVPQQQQQQPQTQPQPQPQLPYNGN